MTGVFLQVRLDSRRLPRKALLPLEGVPLVERAMGSLIRVPAAVHALLTDSDSACDLEDCARHSGFEMFTGSKENVLDRFVSAAARYAVDTIVRATGDNPLVSWQLASMAQRELALRSLDYFAFDGLPLGAGVEVVRADALREAAEASDDPYDLEHVTPYIYRNPKRFRCLRMSAPAAYCCPDARVTVDTEGDYEAVCDLVRGRADQLPVSARGLVRWLDNSSNGDAS